MLKQLTLENYKCFPMIQFDLKRLNLLLGVNSGGKSSVIQALLLCAEASNSGKYKGVIDLINCQYNSNLYSFNEVLYDESEEDEFSITIKDMQDIELFVKYFSTEDDNSVRFEIKQVPGHGIHPLNIFYLPSDRRISQYQKKGNSERIELGTENEYLAYLLDKGRTKRIIAESKRNLIHSDTQLFDLQVNEWLNFILPGNKVISLSSGNSGLMTLGYGMNGNLHATNVGFGVQFVLPILIAGLVAREDDIIIVENPELHLHPQAQSNLAQFFSVIANSGIQVILETHSDHIVNGMRKSIVDQNIELPFRDVGVYYFDQRKKVTEIKLDENAEIDTWPEGFMEQTEKDIYELRRMRQLNANRVNH